jgi:polysaccharide biosynthesis transport protein
MDPSKSSPTADSKLHFLDYWRILRIRKTIILAVFLLVLVTTVVVTYMLPETYSSTARMRVEKDIPDTALMLGSGVGPQPYDAYFLSTEFQVIKSPRILDEVIKQLDLNQKYGVRYKSPQPLTTQESYEILTREIDINQYRNTAIIEVTAFHEDKAQAAQIANEIAKIYQEYRNQIRTGRSDRGWIALTNKLAQYDARVEAAREKADRLRVELQVPEDVAETGVVQTLSAQEQSRIQAEVQGYRSRITRNTKLLTELSSLQGEDLRNVLVIANSTQELNTLIGGLNFAIRQKAGLNPDFGPDFPEVKKWTIQIAKLEEQLDRQVYGITNGMAATLKADNAALQQLEQYLEDAIRKDTEESRRIRPFRMAKQDYENLKRIRDGMAVRVAQEDIDISIGKSSSVEILHNAVPGLTPVKPKKALHIGLGVLAGLVLGVGLAFFIEYLDTSVKTIDDVEHALQAPVLGVIPQNVGSLLLEGGDSPHAEAYRVLRTNLLFSRKDPNGRTMTVVSGGAGEGKSTTIFNLATVFAQNGSRVLIVDSDLRRPSLHKILKVSNAMGLTNFLLKQNKLEEVIQTTAHPSLDFLPSGRLPSSSMGILNSTAMKEFIEEAKSRYDFVFFDSPPIMGVSDASILASEVDMAILVVQYRKYPQQMTLRAKQMVEKVGGKLLGVVLNNINISQDSYYYYYSGYYYDYYSKNEDSKPDQESEVAAKKPSDSSKKKY